jgi:hypothetical protein
MTGEQRDVQQKIVTLQIVRPAKLKFMGKKIHRKSFTNGSNKPKEGARCVNIQLPECQTIWHPVSPVSD